MYNAMGCRNLYHTKVPLAPQGWQRPSGLEM